MTKKQTSATKKAHKILQEYENAKAIVAAENEALRLERIRIVTEQFENALAEYNFADARFFLRELQSLGDKNDYAELFAKASREHMLGKVGEGRLCIVDSRGEVLPIDYTLSCQYLNRGYLAARNGEGRIIYTSPAYPPLGSDSPLLDVLKNI